MSNEQYQFHYTYEDYAKYVEIDYVDIYKKSSWAQDYSIIAQAQALPEYKSATGSGILSGLAAIESHITTFPTDNPQWSITNTLPGQQIVILTDEEAAILAEIRAKGNSATIKKETLTITTITEKKGRKFKEAT